MVVFPDRRGFWGPDLDGGFFRAGGGPGAGFAWWFFRAGGGCGQIVIRIPAARHKFH